MKKSTAYTNPVWVMYECDKGKRFTAVKGGSCDDVDLSSCYISGCVNDHKTRIVGETSDRTKAHNWFRMDV